MTRSGKLLTCALLVVGGLSGLAHEAVAARPLPKHPPYPASSRTGRPIFLGYGWGPYLYYQTYGTGAAVGAPNSRPLRYGYGDSQYGTSDFSFGASGFATSAAELGN